MVDHPDYYARRNLRSNSIENEYMIVAPAKQKSGIGFRAMTQQVKSSKKLGYKFIHAGAAGSGTKISTPEENWEAQGMKAPIGYYAWARLGFNGNIGPLMKSRARSDHKDLRAIAADFQQKFPGISTVSELMLTKKGKKWWQDYGGYFEGTFDLSDGSTSHQVLTRYAAEKQKKSRRKALSALGHDPWVPEAILSNERDQWSLDPGVMKGNEDQKDSAKLDPVCENPDPLTPADEQILDQIWGELARGQGIFNDDSDHSKEFRPSTDNSQ